MKIWTWKRTSVFDTVSKKKTKKKKNFIQASEVIRANSQPTSPTVELEEDVKQEKKKGRVLLAPCCGRETLLPPPAEKDLSSPPVPSFLGCIGTAWAGSRRGRTPFAPRRGRSLFVGSDRHRVGTCTKIEYPKESAAESTKRTQLYTFIII